VCVVEVIVIDDEYRQRSQRPVGLSRRSPLGERAAMGEPGDRLDHVHTSWRALATFEQRVQPPPRGVEHLSMPHRTPDP
jgi:hypothetical protein